MGRTTVLALIVSAVAARLYEPRLLATDIPCEPSSDPVPAYCQDEITYNLPKDGTLVGSYSFNAEEKAATAQKEVDTYGGFCADFFGTKKFQCLKYMWECRGGKVFKLCESICTEAADAGIEKCEAYAKLSTSWEAQCKYDPTNFGTDPATCDSRDSQLFPKGGWGSGVILGTSMLGGLLLLGCVFWSCTRRMRYREALGRQMDSQVDDLDGGSGGAGTSGNNPQAGGVQMSDIGVQEQLDQQQRDIAAQQEYIRRLKAQVAEQEQDATGGQLMQVGAREDSQQHDAI